MANALREDTNHVFEEIISRGFGEPPPPPDDGEGGGGGDGHGGDNSDSFSWRRLFIMASLFAIAEITVGYLLFAPAWR